MVTLLGSPLARLLIGLTLVLLLLPAPALVGSAQTGPPVHPGDRMSTSVGGCTVSFAFDGVGALAGNVYMSTAAHCVSSIGQSVTMAGTPGFATVAYIQAGSTALADDFAFLLVAPQHADRVQAAVRGHPGTPSGVATTPQTGIGDLVLVSGYGTGFSFHALTRESRVGVLYNHGPTHYVMEAPIIFGDSGGPLVHEATGGALGIVSALVAGCCAGPGVWNEGPSVQGMLSKANAAGFTVQLRTA